MMKTRITMDRAGRLVLPKPIRTGLNLSPGDTLELQTAGEQITLRPIRAASPLVREKGVWVFRTGEPLASTVTDALLSDIREQRDRDNLG